MANIFMRAWKDPVWSKIIAAGILGVIGIASALISHYVAPAYQYLSYPIPLWLGSILIAIAFAVGTWLASRRPDQIPSFGPVVTMTDVNVPDPNPAKMLTHPLKIYWTFRNDSVACIEVSLFDFRPKNIKLEGKPPGVMQVLMGQQWLPSDHGMDKVAVLPGQMFRGWVPVDQRQYTAVQVRGHIHDLGTLVLKVNGHPQEFVL